GAKIVKALFHPVGHPQSMASHAFPPGHTVDDGRLDDRPGRPAVVVDGHDTSGNGHTVGWAHSFQRALAFHADGLKPLASILRLLSNDLALDVGSRKADLVVHPKRDPELERVGAHLIEDVPPLFREKAGLVRIRAVERPRRSQV